MQINSSNQENQIVIYGINSNGKTFRPSDWTDRLCGILTSFTDDKNFLSYEWVKPLVIDNVRCITIAAQLRDTNPTMFRFLMDFAADNDLQIVSNLDDEPLTPDTMSSESEPQSELITESQSLCSLPEETDIPQIYLREISSAQTATAFSVLSVLRPTLNDINRFIEQVNEIQRAQGYRLLGIFEEGKANAVAVCGFREKTDLVCGKHLHIDDLVTIPQCRRRGYASRLLESVRQIAVQQGITQIRVDCHVDAERNIAHRMYFRHGFSIHSYHFVCTCDI